MADKTTSEDSMNTLIQLLEEKQISQKSKEICEAPITEQDTRHAIKGMGKNKTAGPDDIPGDFYRYYSNMITKDYTQVLNAAFKQGEMIPTHMQGQITLLYKKGDRTDPRNYRPITLLNADYKILAKIHGHRTKQVVDDIISAAQNGFVPRRLITDCTHMTLLLQSWLNEEAADPEKDESNGGIFLFQDFEKAFDRVSWKYLNKAVAALGFGENYQRWFSMFYNADTPTPPQRPQQQHSQNPINKKLPQRSTIINGEPSEPFNIQSGVAQGCPFSPLVFLFVTESLTRLFAKSDIGIKVGNHTLQISQFADDSILFLRNHEQAKEANRLMQIYCEGTGMRLNHKKTEGLACGDMRHKTPNEHTKHAAWCEEGKFIKSLGIPIGNNFDPQDFWLAKYQKAKALISKWRGLYKETMVGRVMLGNAMFYSRFRYWSMSMVMPESIINAIESDFDELMWAADPNLEEDETGTHGAHAKRIARHALYLPLSKGGTGRLNWRLHTHALRVKAALHYVNASRSAYKIILDRYIADRHNEGRGILFTTLPETNPSAINQPKADPHNKHLTLPTFWKQAIQSLTITNPTPAGEDYQSEEEARSASYWYNKRFKPATDRNIELWRTKLDLNRLGDFPDSGEIPDITTPPDISEYVAKGVAAHSSTGKAERMITKEFDRHGKQLQKDWPRLWLSIPENHRRTLRGETHRTELPNAVKWMRAMGWTGKGLGKNQQGETRTVADKIHKHQPQNHLSAHTEQRQQSQDRYRSTEDGTIVKLVDPTTLRVHDLSPTGKPLPSHHTISTFEDDGSPRKTYKITRWKGNILGIAERVSPHPKGWKIGDRTIDNCTTKSIYTHLLSTHSSPPNCEGRWKEILDNDTLDLNPVWQEWQKTVLTPRDSGTALKAIHRALNVKDRGDPRYDDDLCRLCGQEKESHLHLTDCPCTHDVFEPIRQLAEKIEPRTPNHLTPELILFQLDPSNRILNPPTRALFQTTWKLLWMQLYQVEIEGKVYDSKEIITRTLRRLQERISAHAFAARRGLARTIGTGDRKAKIGTAHNKKIKPLAHLSPEGALTYSPHFHAIANRYGIRLDEEQEQEETTYKSPIPDLLRRLANLKKRKFHPPTSYHHLPPSKRYKWQSHRPTNTPHTNEPNTPHQ